MIMKRTRIMIDVAKNFFGRSADVTYIIEDAGWSIYWDGYYLTKALNHTTNVHSVLRRTVRGLHSTIVHLGSWGTYRASNRLHNINRSNQTILTIFHVAGQIHSEDVALINKRVKTVHTSSSITKQQLVELGIAQEHIAVIPLGVDAQAFHPITPKEKAALREKLKLPNNHRLIGSFQKDGVGWGDGLEPKMIKGPDVFLRVMQQLAQSFPIHVVLTGPARGYVMQGLKKLGIPYTHRFLKNYYDVVRYYQALDLYMVTSRVEGGPKAILEAGACGVPVVTTRVGMAPDVIIDGVNGYLTEVGDVARLVQSAGLILNDPKLAHQLGTQLSQTVQAYDWSAIAKQYSKELYESLL